MTKKITTFKLIDDKENAFADGKGVVSLDSMMPDKMIAKIIRNRIKMANGKPF